MMRVLKLIERFWKRSFSKITDVKLKEFLLPYLKKSDFISADKKEQLQL